MVYLVQRLGSRSNIKGIIFQFLEGTNYLLLPKVSRPALGQTQSLTQKDSRGSLSLWSDSQGVKLTAHPHTAAR